jgi:predicted TIM-barrel fold metal-dependent hydrolase
VRIASTRAGLMQDLILAYPDVTFCMFHGSFPYWHELGAMAKNCPNVCI